MKLDSLKQLYIHELSDLQDAEEQLVKALPKMAKAASAPELCRAFEMHLGETEGQIRRLEKLFTLVGEKPARVSCKGMKGLIAEGEELIGNSGNPAVKDAGLIAAAQRVEHYEIAGYGCARTFAQMLGDEESARLLQTSLNEEKEADEMLNKLAKHMINIEAAHALA